MKAGRVYMDNNAATPLHPAVKAVMTEYIDVYGNPSSMHESGREAKAAVEEARSRVAGLINVSEENILFTSGGSESNNTVIKGLFDYILESRAAGTNRSELIISAIEHPSVLETAEYLKGRGITVHKVPVDSSGRIDFDAFGRLLSERTALVSVIHGNNEIGTIQDIKAVCEKAHAAGALVHTDAVQTVGKVPVDVQKLGADYLSISAHKIYGPKGAGALYAGRKTPLYPLLHGGHQEDGRRAGTYNTLSLIGFGTAAKTAREEMAEDAVRLSGLKRKLKEGIEAGIPEIRVNSPEENCLPGTLDVSFSGAEGESILLYLDMEGIEVSTGSACATGSLEPSHVLLGIGLDAEYAHGSIRFSLGRENTENDVDFVLEKLPPVIERIRKMSTRY